MARHEPQVLYLGDLQVGDEWESPARTVTETDVVRFAGLSGDFNPLHTDHEFARATPFGKPIAHGLLGLTLVSGLASHAPRVRTLAFLTILEWAFEQPIYFGDTLRVISEIRKIEPRPRGRRGVVTWHRRLINQRGTVVQHGLTQTLVEARPADSAVAPPPESS